MEYNPQSSCESIDYKQLKSPVQVLQEILNKRQIQAEFYFLEDKDKRKFYCKVSFGDYTGEGDASQKMRAKQEAAKDLLDKLAGRVISKEFYYEPDANIESNNFPQKSLLSPMSTDPSSSDDQYQSPAEKLSIYLSMTKKVATISFEENQIDARIFDCSIELDDLKATGVGTNKKIAKQDASRILIAMLKERGIDVPEVITEKRKKSPKPSQNSLEKILSSEYIRTKNFIGALQELCASRKLPLPKYDLEMEIGDAHDKSFAYRCSVGDIITTGSGKAKAQSKQSAAGAMLRDLVGKFYSFAFHSIQDF